MAAESTSTKVRFVRCPKCRKLLPELPDIQVYRCGGCGVTLQAKNRVNGLRSKSAGLAAQMNGLGHVSDDKPSSSSSCDATLPDPGQCSSGQIDDTTSSCSTLLDSGKGIMDRDNERGESKSSDGLESSISNPKATVVVPGECSLEQKNETDESMSPEGTKSSSSSPKATIPNLGEGLLERINERDESRRSEGVETSSLSPKATFPDPGKYFLDHNNEKNQDKSSVDEDSSILSHKAILPESVECTSNQNNGWDTDKSSEEDCRSEQIGEAQVPNEDQNNQNDKNISLDLDSEQLGVSNANCSSLEFSSDETRESVPTRRASSKALIHDDSLPLAQSNLEVDMNIEIGSVSSCSNAVTAVETRESSSIMSTHVPPRESISSDILISSPNEQSHAKEEISMAIYSDFRSSSAVKPGATRENDLEVTAQTPARESISSDTLTSSPNEELSVRIQKRFDHFKSLDTFDATEYLSPRSELSTAVTDMRKSPATKSHHEYEASVSSYDGMDDQFISQNLRAFQAENFVHSETRYRKENFPVEIMRSRDYGLQNRDRNSWSSMSDKNDAMKYRHRDHNELLPPRRQGHTSRDFAIVQRDNYMHQDPRMAFLRRGSVGGYDNGGFTNQMPNEFQRISSYQSDMSMGAEPDKLTLLRMVYELQNQVDSLNVNASRHEKHIPQYHAYEPSEEELFHRPSHHRGLRGSRAGSHCSHQQRKSTQIPFSSEAATSRHHVDTSYMHRHPQDWPYSAPMLQPIPRNSTMLYGVHPDYSCGPSSQWCSESVSDDQRYNSPEIKKYFGEKQQKAKRHFRPIAGGAPIISCYNCYKPLQIPADFLLFKRKCHRLQCGACLKVLKFSVQKRTHIIPYGVNSIGPPPSDLEDYNYGVNTDPVSCSDDYGYGPSYNKSGSTEGGEPGNVTPSNSLQDDEVLDRNMSHDSDYPTRETENIVLGHFRSQNKGKNPGVERFISARTSSSKLRQKNISSEIEELAPKSSSPLHRLMGYKSPSLVIRGSGLSRSGTKSSSKR